YTDKNNPCARCQKKGLDCGAKEKVKFQRKRQLEVTANTPLPESPTRIEERLSLTNDEPLLPQIVDHIDNSDITVIVRKLLIEIAERKGDSAWIDALVKELWGNRLLSQKLEYDDSFGFPLPPVPEEIDLQREVPGPHLDYMSMSFSHNPTPSPAPPPRAPVFAASIDPQVLELQEGHTTFPNISLMAGPPQPINNHPVMNSTSYA